MNICFLCHGSYTGHVASRAWPAPPFRVCVMASFEFPPGGDKFLCERPFFDSGAIGRALSLG